MNVVSRLLYITSAVAQVVFVALFLLHNQPGLTNFVGIAALGFVYTVIFLLTAVIGFRGQKVPCYFPNKIAKLAFALTVAVLIVYVVLDNLVFDYFQAISTSDPVIYTWIASWALILINLLISLPSLITAKDLKSSYQLTHSLNYALVTLLGVPVMMLVSVMTNPVTHQQLTIKQDVFVGGIDGYKVYRIPAMLVLPKDSILSNGELLTSDRIIVMAEARRDGALDTGVIDLVQKTSDNGGKSWSKQSIICQYKVDNMRGKCGNATPVFDQESGKVFLAYNLSGIPVDAPEGKRPHSSSIMTSLDGGLTWDKGIELAMPNSVFGPGHGIQKLKAPHKGRLVIPYNTSVGGKGSSLAMFSDDNGQSWQQGKPLGLGNENELAELANGDLLMATRHNAPIGQPPSPNGRLFSLSTDGGLNWQTPTVDQQLITPICQASLLSIHNNTGLLFLNPADETARVKLTLRYSNNQSQSWQNEALIFSGPSGYSQLGMTSDNNILALYENGTLSYSEKISFAKLPFEQLSK